MCAAVCVRACECSCLWRSEAMGALELRVEIVGSRLTCVLRVQLGPSGRTECLNCLVPSPAPVWGYFQEKKNCLSLMFGLFFFLFCFTFTHLGACFPRFLEEMGFSLMDIAERIKASTQWLPGHLCYGTTLSIQ